MLQWMGGGRRRLKTTRKSIEARQRHFFEQQRQQKRSEVAQISAPCKTSSSQHYLPQQETVCSLDIASLKNLSRLAQVESNHASGKVDVSGNGTPLEATGDLSVILKPNKPGIQSEGLSVFQKKPVNPGEEELPATGMAPKSQGEQTLPNVHTLNTERKESQKHEGNVKNCKKQMNPQHQTVITQGNEKFHKEFSKFDILDIICAHEMEEGKKSSSCEFYVASMMHEVYESDPNSEADDESNDETHSTCKSKVSSTRRVNEKPDYFITLRSACGSKSRGFDSLLQSETFGLEGINDFFHCTGFQSPNVYQSFLDDIDGGFDLGNTAATKKNSKNTICQTPETSNEIFDPLKCACPASIYEQTACDNSQEHSLYQAEYGVSLEESDQDIFSEFNVRTNCFEVRDPLLSCLFPERLAGHVKQGNTDGKSPIFYPSSDDELSSSDTFTHVAFDATEHLTEKEDHMIEGFGKIASFSGETCLESGFQDIPVSFDKPNLIRPPNNADISHSYNGDSAFKQFGGTEDENSAVAVVDYLTTWILTKKPRKCRSPKKICRSKFSDLKEIEDDHDCDSRISVSSVSESLKQSRNMEGAATVESTVSMPGTHQEEKINPVNSSSPEVSQGCSNCLDVLEKTTKNASAPLIPSKGAISHADFPRNERKAAGNTVLDILARLKKPSQDVLHRREEY